MTSSTLANATVFTLRSSAAMAHRTTPSRAAADPALVLDPHVVTFFYGSYINPAVLREVNLVPRRFEVARLAGFDISIDPLANLVPSERSVVYGVLAEATHDELDRLYRHARDVLGGVYLPRPIVAETVDGYFKPALCYIAPELASGVPSPEYVHRIIEPATSPRVPGLVHRSVEVVHSVI